MIHMRACIPVIASLLFASHPLLAALTKPVPTESGLVSGVPATDRSITVFKGIPYASPPVNDRRWREPLPPVKWKGVRDGSKFGANCVQTIVEEKKPWTYEFMAHGEVSEDCLFLNIWTAAGNARERRPVLVYLHGGANTEGSGSIDAYNGQGLARKGVVMITINYRLGLFGFFAHPELTAESPNHSSGNYALQDQLAALRWVRKNIAAFGGDPARVTVAGQSAGASDISLLCLSPLAKGLFRGAILESGGVPTGGAGRALFAAEADGLKFAAAKGAGTLAELRALPWKDLFMPVAGLRFGPIADGYIVTAALGKRIDVPVLAGWNADENGASPKSAVTAAQFQAQAQQRYGEAAAEFLKIYPAANDEETRAASNAAARDRQRVVMSEWAASLSRAYIYFYGHVLPGPDSAQYGAFHTSEVPYVLNSIAESKRPFTAEDRKIAEILSSYWANFAANGNPNGKGLPYWPSARERPGMVMEIGDANRPIDAAATKQKYEFLKKAITPGPAR